jgi:predicted DNA repair protein MutK
MVGGGIITHDVAFFHHISQIIMDQLSHLFISSLSSLLFNIFIGLIFGGLVLTVVTFYNKLRSDS